MDGGAWRAAVHEVATDMEGTVMTPAQMHAAYKKFVSEIGEGKTF